MADRDPAFQWETEALRAGSRVRRESAADRHSADALEPGWVTMRQAEGATGVPVGTLRRWARRGSIPSRYQMTDTGERRLIWLDAVLERAAVLGRSAVSTPRPEEESVPDRPTPPPPPPRPAVDMVERTQPDRSRETDPGVPDPQSSAGHARDTGASREPDPAGQPSPQHHSPGAGPKVAPPEPPSGTMLVPVDAWNKMLMQLGNLHEAGRDLAEARERAAKAETEATFLRERLKELREQSAATPVADERPRRRRWFGG